MITVVSQYLLLQGTKGTQFNAWTKPQSGTVIKRDDIMGTPSSRTPVGPRIYGSRGAVAAVPMLSPPAPECAEWVLRAPRAPLRPKHRARSAPSSGVRLPSGARRHTVAALPLQLLGCGRSKVQKARA